MLHDLGYFDKAGQCYEKVIALQSDFAPAYLTLAKMRKFSGNEELINTIEREIDRPGSTDQQRMFLSFALAKIYEDISNYSRSFACLVEANRLKRKSFSYAISESENLFASIKKSFAQSPGSERQAESGGTVPIFILGMPRSGTSLVEQILASHPAVYGAGELNNFQAAMLTTAQTDSLSAALALVTGDPDGKGRELGTRYLASLEFLPGNAQYITDKMPNNFLLIGAIRMSLPEAKIIHCIRKPMDNCLSIYKNYFAGHLPYAYDLNELGRYYLLYLDLMDFWRQQFPEAIHDIKYENLLQDQEAETQDLLKFCGLPWDEGCLSYHRTQRPVATASAAQVRKPLYRDSVALWKRYRKELEPLRAILGEDSSIS